MPLRRTSNESASRLIRETFATPDIQTDEEMVDQAREKKRNQKRRDRRAKTANDHSNISRVGLKSIVALGLRCQRHNTLALFRAKTVDHKCLYWLPYTQNCSSKCSIYKQINAFLLECYETTIGTKICLSATHTMNRIVRKLYLLSWIKVAPFASLLPMFDQKIFVGDIVPEYCFCEHKTGPLKWIPLSFFQNADNNSDCCRNKEHEDLIILGIEVDKVVETFQNASNIASMRSVSSSYEEITDTEIIYPLEIDQYRVHMEKIGYNRTKIFKLYQDFQNITYPSLTLCEKSFKAFFSYFISQDDFDLGELFRVFSHINGKYLTFPEMLLGLSFMEPEAGLTNMRVSFIFDYFRLGTEGTIKIDQVLKYMKIAENKIDGENGEKFMKYFDFQCWIKSLETETSKILKARKSSIMQICSKDFFPKATILDDFPEFSTEYNRNTCCSSSEVHKLVPYWMCHETKLLNRITDLENFVEPIKPILKNNIPVKALLSETKTVVYQTLEELRLLRDDIGEKKEKFARNERFYNVINVQNMLKVFDSARKLFLSESSLLKINSPCLIFGDIHGNLHDLLFYEKHLWPHSPIIHPFNTLFLGDYVDRGELSLEVALYLFSMKILMPNKIFMIRGNHELRHVQISYTFEKECLTKLGKVVGRIVFEAANKAFDSLPLAAVVGGRLFCSHGGIPATDNCLENIAQIDKVIFSEQKSDKVPHSDSQSPIAWQLLWNDPFEDERYFREYLGTCMWSADVDFIPNIARGTAMYFLQNSVRNFIETNQLSYVIRAHECPFFGSRLQFDSRLCTVFSCSNYCGKNNFSGFLLVDKPEVFYNNYQQSNPKVGLIHRFSIDRPQIEPDWLKNAKEKENSQKDE